MYDKADGVQCVHKQGAWSQEMQMSVRFLVCLAAACFELERGRVYDVWCNPNCILSADHRGKNGRRSVLLIKALCFNSQTGFILIMISAFNGLSVVDVYGYDFDAFCGSGNRLKQVVFDEGS
mgnify:FL=1